MTTDEELEAFLDQDLSDLDFACFQPLRLEPRDAIPPAADWKA